MNSTKGEDAIMSLRIASYYIHGWVDADMESILERVAEVGNLQDPDILCLQVKNVSYFVTAQFTTAFSCRESAKAK